MRLPTTRTRLLHILPWLLFAGLYFALTAGIVATLQTGPLPPDLATYVHAADRLRSGDPLYLSPQATQSVWRAMHAIEPVNVVENPDAAAVNNIPGPYLYPPTLALWYLRLGLTPGVWMWLSYGSIVGFALVWLASAGGAGMGAERTHRSGWWVLLALFSLAVFNTLGGGNVEGLLLFCTLVAARLIWSYGRLWTAPVAALLIAIVVLIKPFYALFFAAFGLLVMISARNDRPRAWRYLIVTALLALVFIAVDVLLWGAALRQEAVAYLSNALAHQVYALPVAEQTPMSIWNRTLMQGLVALGVRAELAQQLALVVWGVGVAVTLWIVRGRRISFALAFGLALVLLYWARPVGWGFVYLELVVLTTAWPALGRWPRVILLSATLLYMLSHWLALFLTLQGVWLRLMTLQSAAFPWEAWLIAPLAWLVLLYAHSRTSVGTESSPSQVTHCNIESIGVRPI